MDLLGLLRRVSGSVYCISLPPFPGFAWREGRDQLTYLKSYEDEEPVAIHFKPRIAAQIILSLASGIAGANAPLLVASAILICVMALKDIKEVATAAESLLFWIVYSSKDHSVSQAEAKTIFKQEAMKYPSLPEEGFDAALHTLHRAGYIRLDKENVYLADPVVIHRKMNPRD